MINDISHTTHVPTSAYNSQSDVCLDSQGGILFLRHGAPIACPQYCYKHYTDVTLFITYWKVLFYEYCFGHCSAELGTILPTARTCSIRTRASTRSQPFTVFMPSLCTSSHSSAFAFRTAKLWNQLPASVFATVRISDPVFQGTSQSIKSNGFLNLNLLSATL